MNESMIQFSYDGLCLQFDKENLRYSILTGKTTWETDEFFSPFFRVQSCDKPIYFKDAEVQKHELVKSGVGEGIRSSYRDFVLSKSAGCESGKEETLSFAFETFVWIEYSTKQVYFEWIPFTEAPENAIEQVFFPGPFSFQKERNDWYTILPKEQGILIPNTWDVSFKQDGFNGRFGTASAYLPVFGQVKEGILRKVSRHGTWAMKRYMRPEQTRPRCNSG